MSRKTISVRKDVYDRLDDAKHDDESWSDCLERLVESPAGGDEHGPNALTEEHIDDIVSRTAARTVHELENSLTGR